MIKNPTPESPRPTPGFENINPSADRTRPSGRRFGGKAEGAYNRMPQQGKSIASRIYDGLYKIPGINRIVGRMEIAFNQMFLNRHEKKAVNLKTQLDSFDMIISNFDQSKAGIESAIENLRQQGMPGAESLQLQIKKIDQEKNAVLLKRDKIQSKFEARENKMKLYTNSRDLIANKLIGHFDEKLRPMESELANLQERKRMADVSIAVMETRHAKTLERLSGLENMKNQLAEALALSGMSERKIRRSAVMKLYDEQISQGHECMRKEKESMEIRKSRIDARIAEVDKDSNPYRDKREEFVRIKENRPLDMDVETRKRNAGFEGREEIRGHVRGVESDATSGSGGSRERMAETRGQIPARALLNDWNRYINKGVGNGVDFGRSSLIDQRDFFNISGLSQNELLGVKGFMNILKEYYKFRKVDNSNLNEAIKIFSEQS